MFPSHCTVAPGAPRQQVVVSAPPTTGQPQEPALGYLHWLRLLTNSRQTSKSGSQGPLPGSAIPAVEESSSRKGGRARVLSPERSRTRSQRTPTALCLPAPAPPTPCAEPASRLGCRPSLLERATVLNSRDTVCNRSPPIFTKLIDLCWAARACSRCGCGRLTAVASLAAAPGLQAQVNGRSAWAELLSGRWDPPDQASTPASRTGGRGLAH